MTAVVATDIAGRLILNKRALEYFGKPADMAPAPDRWGEIFHLYDPVTRMPLSPGMVPGMRALQEGRVEGQVVLVAPPGMPERLLTVAAEASYDDDGNAVGATAKARPATRAELEALTVPDDYTVPCSCGDWCLTFPANTPSEWIQESLEEHRSGCPDLALSHLRAS